jgi:cytochrome P450
MSTLQTPVTPLKLDQWDVVKPEVDFGLNEVPDLVEVLRDLRRHGSAVAINYAGRPAWVILDYDDVNSAFQDNVNFDITQGHTILSEATLGHNVQMMSGQEHRQHRGLVNPMFMPRAVRSYVEAAIEPIAHELLDRIEGRSEVDFVACFARLFPFTVITRLLGIPVDDEERMMTCALKIFDFTQDPEGARAARESFDAEMQGLIDARRLEPRDDMITTMLNAEYEGKSLDDSEMATFCRLLFPAGSDTTYKNVGSMFAEVLADERLREAAKRDDAAREAIAAESLRLHPPIALQIRMATGTVVIGDAEIQAGDWCFFAISYANRDPKIFADPDRFDPSRDNRLLITFGRGAHFCLGMHLARRELEVALKAVLERFPDMRLVPDKTVEIVNSIFRGPKELWVYPYGEP